MLADPGADHPNLSGRTFHQRRAAERDRQLASAESVFLADLAPVRYVLLV
jgi:hypothetical protein